jgi:hypothetical protein
VLPLVAFVPAQPPEAVHEATFVLLQLRVDVPPDATLVGLACRVTVGVDITATVAVAEAGVVPVAPEQVSV